MIFLIKLEGNKNTQKEKCGLLENLHGIEWRARKGSLVL